ncbi:hypothetical protein [Niabella beijingensis]|uniref:hypothetical protein n=1 Tax=Niabella beijingensis TaxID=2872700 RepID=UPI001CBDC63C|nr:hypothetical protein [Niabella beijingensis]MBZ4191709.1 hypothetical protein [Niabella beijingensis]
MSFKIDSQLSENQIESDVSSYLGYITPFWSKRFRLISVDEQTTGADKLFNRFIPIYLQFKVSHGLNPISPIALQFQKKPLANIINYRKNNNLSGNPILYFQLRKQAKTAQDLQHNILFQLNKPPQQYSLYVAPLTLEIAEYEKLLDADWLMKFYRFNPFFDRDFELHDTSSQRDILLGSNPFLRHHISIPPHTLVNTHDHHYSYSKSGGDVAWHGGEILSDDFRFSNQLLKILNTSYNRDFSFSQRQFIEFINDFDDYRNVNNNEDDIFQILRFSNYLKTTHNIRMLLLQFP